MIAAARRAIGALRARLAARPDTEHEQAIVRLVVGVLIVAYLVPGALANPHEPTMAIMLAYLAIATLIFGVVSMSSAVSPVRRLLGAALDVATLTSVMAFLDDRAAPLFLVFVWVTLANGFRFGGRYLIGSLLLSLAGFGTVLATSEYWHEHMNLGIGLSIGFVALSVYVLSLVNRMFDALQRAEAANQAKRRFISMVSHELRTPLNAIVGMADLLRDSGLSREQADMLQTLRNSSGVMLGLVEDVLDFSKIEAGKMVLDATDFDLHALVNSTSRMLATHAGIKGVDFVVSIMPDVPHALRGDAHHLRQILINLAGNAVKFTERGSVTLHVAAQSEVLDRVRLKFSIRDTGVGIAPAAQGRIFESFTQADQSTTRRFGGTGLGTTIAKQLVELMDGRIGLESAVGLGSTFWFEVELQKQPERAGAGIGELAGQRLLLVGFPEPELGALTLALGGWGAVAIQAPGVDQAVERLVSEISVARPYYGVVLYSSAESAGLARRFRQLAPEPAPPLILAVPREANVARFQVLSEGFSAVLEMPCDKRQLFNVIHSVSAGQDVGEGVVRLHDYASRSGGTRKLRVLVADDNATNREVLGKILERAGHEFVLVEDGEGALDRLEDELFDVVIVDRNMPGLGGIQTIQAIRLMGQGRDRVPVVMLSADATPESRKDGLAAGADAFLSKPVEPARLIEQIQTVAAGRTPAQPTKIRELATAPRSVKSSAGVPIVSIETLRHLEDLGSSAGFLERLVGIFVSDNTQLLDSLDAAAASRNHQEYRSALHAMKGSAASLGAERLTLACTEFGRLSDAEFRHKALDAVRSIHDEFVAARAELERYVRERIQSAG